MASENQFNIPKSPYWLVNLSKIVGNFFGQQIYVVTGDIQMGDKPDLFVAPTKQNPPRGKMRAQAISRPIWQSDKYHIGLYRFWVHLDGFDP